VRNLRIGFDCDGVLCDFSGRFVQMANQMFGTNCRASDQATWDYEQFSKAQVDKVWAEIRTTRDFWAKLDAIEPDVTLDDVEALHTPIFITSRVPVAGDSIEMQTQSWLLEKKFVTFPTVLVVPHYSLKLPLMQALKLDSYIDDKAETVEQLQAVGLNCYIYDQPYNQAVTCAPRVKSISEYIKDVEAKLGTI